VQRIQSLSSPQLRRLKRLHRVESGQREFLIEGTHLLTEALTVHWPLSSLYYTEKWASENREFAKRVQDTVENYLVEPHWLKQAVTTQNPDGVVAIGKLEPKDHSRALDELSSDRSHWSLALATDGIQDPGNAGTLLRSLVGLGGNRLYLRIRFLRCIRSFCEVPLANGFGAHQRSRESRSCRSTPGAWGQR